MFVGPITISLVIAKLIRVRRNPKVICLQLQQEPVVFLTILGVSACGKNRELAEMRLFAD